MTEGSTTERGPGRYQRVECLNHGSSGYVDLARCKVTNELVAVKSIPRGEKINRHVIREILNHRNLLHHHVIQFKEVFLTKEYLCIVMEYAPGGDVMDYMKKKNGLTEDEARWFFQQLILGLDYCHKMGVVNRDIKLENSLLDGSPWPVLKICDFGFSKHEMLNSAPDSRVGTPAYLAPEVVSNTRGETYDGKMADIWSCGVFLYVMLMGSYPFEKPDDKQCANNERIRRILTRITGLDYTIPDSVPISEEGRDLIGKIFVQEPSARITMEGIMAHPWFNYRLPSGAKKMNEILHQQNTGLQSVQDIVKIVECAKTRDPEMDELAAIDDELEKVSMESAEAAGFP
eukprot:evm.model.scf_823.11 EVM.evm.TU.scf_823.11   scf_823:61607-62918(+)